MVQQRVRREEGEKKMEEASDWPLEENRSLLVPAKKASEDDEEGKESKGRRGGRLYIGSWPTILWLPPPHSAEAANHWADDSHAALA